MDYKLKRVISEIENGNIQSAYIYELVDTYYQCVICKIDEYDDDEEPKDEVIIDSLHPTVLDKYNYHMIAASFRESILSPLTMNIEAAQGAGLLAMLNYFRGSSFSFTPILLDKTTESAFEYNGPGKPVWDNAGKMQKNGQRPVSLSKLRSLMISVDKKDTIARVL